MTYFQPMITWLLEPVRVASLWLTVSVKTLVSRANGRRAYEHANSPPDTTVLVIEAGQL